MNDISSEKLCSADCSLKAPGKQIPAAEGNSEFNTVSLPQCAFKAPMPCEGRAMVACLWRFSDLA